MLGALTMGLSVLLASRSDQLWQFHAVFFIGSFIGGGSLFAPILLNTGRWFKKGVGSLPSVSHLRDKRWARVLSPI